MENKMGSYCRICGFESEDAWSKDDYCPSYAICPCCGAEFGYDDMDVCAVTTYREKWLKKGAKWFSPKKKPENWSLEEQMKNIPNKYLK
jgi:hypothetical protein